MSQASDYTRLIPSENADKPKFSAMVALVAGCFSDATNSFQSLEEALNLDTAVGAQLDILGLWIGLSRNLEVPFSVYFSFDISGLGFDQGNWIGPYDPSSGLTQMDDATYRQMLKAKIGANRWDGSMPSFRTILAEVFAGTGITITAVDNQDMTMDVTFSAKPPAIIMALLSGGYLPLKPEGVLQTFHFPT